MLWLTRTSLRYPTACLLLLAAITVTLGLGLPNLRTEYGYRVLIGDDHPSIRALDEFIAQFGGGLPTLVVWPCGDGQPCESALDPVSLRMAHALASRLSSSRGVRKAEGVANAPLLVPSPEGFAVRRMVEGGELAEDLDQLVKRALTDPLWVDRLISKDGRVGVVVVQTFETSSKANEELVQLLEDALRPYEAQGFEYYLVGDAIDTVTAGRDLAKSTARLIPFTVMVISVVILLLASSWQHVMMAIGSLAVALVWTFGFLGWFAWPQDSIVEVLAPLILVVGVCDSVHLLSVYAGRLADLGAAATRASRSEAMLEAASETGLPCLMTTLTTAVAFASFVTSPLDTFVRFGVVSAIGVSSCLTLTFTFVPLLALHLPDSGRRGSTVSSLWGSTLSTMIRATQRRAAGILALSAAALGICGIGWATRLEADTRWLESWGEQSPIVKSIRFVEKHLGRCMTLEVELILPAQSSLEDPESIYAIERFAEFLDGGIGLGRVTSVLDLMRRLNRLLHDNDPSRERPANSLLGNAELLELLAFDDPSVLGSWVSLDRSRLRIAVDAWETPFLSSSRIIDSINSYVRAELPADWRVVLTGEFAMTVHWIRDVQSTQLRSFPTALVLVFLLVWVFFRSFWLALAAMVPTVLPVVVTLGAMGWAGMTLDVGRAMIAAIMIGIAVDDAIHLLNHYQLRREMGDRPSDAIGQAILHTGRAVVTTSLALSLGFLTLMMSAWQTISSFGFFVSLAILAALAAALLVLPALIFVFAKDD